MTDPEEVDSSHEEAAYSEQAKEAGHRLYQWVYHQIAEGEELDGQKVKVRLEAENLSERDKHDAFKVAMSESEFYRTDLHPETSDEDWEKQTMLHQNVWLTISDADLRTHEEEFPGEGG